jgi:hypothetical protein
MSQAGGSLPYSVQDGGRWGRGQTGTAEDDTLAGGP